MRPVITDLVAVHGQRPCPYTSNAHGKNTHKIKTTKQNQEKSRVQPQKKLKNKQEGSKNERKTEAKRTKTPTQNEQKPRLRTNKSPDSEPRSRLRSQSEKKRGVKTPQKIYASFCEMEPIVLKKTTPSFCGL